ncbi:MAG: N-acetylmuramoyl-L-alanine amidase [Flavobacteriaceae bacterium]|nr:N-acetylmuramoyl-L-alanine amidase [Flavobacteriaceae bacterium]
MQIKSFFTILLCFFGLITKAQLKNDTKSFVVVLDAGHGGKDPGRPTSYGYKEKDIALDIVLKVGKNLESVPGVSVIYTRKTDIFLELRERATIANKADADLFVSVHCNAHDSQAHGTETYVLGLHRNDSNFKVAQKENEVIFLEKDYEKNYEGFDPTSPESFIGLTLLQEDYLDQSILLASTIQKNFTETLKRKNRGVKQAGFWVLHNTYMPSVLVETGFITNKKEGDYLNSKRGKIEVSKSISDAILSYKSILNPDIDILETPISTPLETANIIFKVQIAASSKKLALKPYNFNGLDELSRKKKGKIWRYFYGETKDYNQAVIMKDMVVSRGYTTAFVVAYLNGDRISIENAIKTKNN